MLPARFSDRLDEAMEVQPGGLLLERLQIDLDPRGPLVVFRFPAVRAHQPRPFPAVVNRQAMLGHHRTPAFTGAGLHYSLGAEAPVTVDDSEGT